MNDEPGEQNKTNFAQRILEAVGGTGYQVVVNRGSATQSETSIKATGSDQRLEIRGPAEIGRVGEASQIRLEPGGRITFDKSMRQGPTRVKVRQNPQEQIVALPDSQIRYSVVMTKRGIGSFPLFRPSQNYRGEGVSPQEIQGKMADGWTLRQVLVCDKKRR